jgi:hypothetical protein
VSRTALVRLAVLLGAAACVLIAFKALPGFQTGTDLSRRPAVIVNDTTGAVVVAHCDDGACRRTSGPATVAPGQSLRLGSGSWAIDDPSGARVGCLAAVSAGQRLLVSQAEACPG